MRNTVRVLVAPVTFAAMGLSASQSAAPAGRIEDLPPMEATRCVTPAATFHAVNPWILRAILKVESGYNPRAVNRNPNKTEDVGMAQINSMHFAELSRHGIAPAHLMDGCISTYVAAWMLARQMRVHGNTWFGIASYHSTTPCFNTRYAGLIWNALVEMGATTGQRLRVRSLEQCGFKGVASQKPKGAGASSATLAFDAD